MIMHLHNIEAVCYCAYVKPCKAGEIGTYRRSDHGLLKDQRLVEQDPEPGGNHVSREAS